MTTSIKFLGMAGYEIVGPKYRMLIDPFLTANPFAPLTVDEIEKPDVILVSHAAYDHLGDAPELAKRTGAPVVCGGDVKAILLERGIPESQIHATIWGIVVDINGVVVRPVESHHWSQARLQTGQYISGVPMGFIVEPQPGLRIYHCGDTAIFGDLKLIGELYKPTVGLMGCSNGQAILQQNRTAGRILNGEMSPREAALASEFLGLQIAVASHYLDLENAIEAHEVEEFVSSVHELDSTGQRQALSLEVGERLVWEDGVVRKER